MFHYHFYLHFDTPVSLASVVKAFGEGSGVHCEIAKGSYAEGKVYVTKESDRVPGVSILEWGVPPSQGKRKDIDVVREVLQGGGGMRQVASSASSYQSLRCAEVLLKYFEAKRDFLPEVYWYHGATATGKTRRAFDFFLECKTRFEWTDDEDVWISGKNLQWWEGYDANKFIVIDDFRRDFCTFHELLRVLDRYPYRVMTKGGSRQLLARVIIITCPWKPEVLFNTRSDEDIGQLLRRITSVELFGEEEVAAPEPRVASVSHFRQS